MRYISKFRFTNWAGNSSCLAENYYQPETEGELADIIRKSEKISIVGSGHSWSPLCLNKESLINLDLFSKILFFDGQNLKIKVQAGIKLWELNRFLDKHGFALSNLGSVSDQSLAGAISTGTHGSGIQFQLLASQVEEFSLIKADGEKLNIHRRRNKDLFYLSLVNLGSLGVISEITLNIVPAFRLHDESYVMRFDDIIEKLDEFVTGTDHFKIWWFPHIDQAVVFHYTRTQEPVNDSKLRQWLMEQFISASVYRLLLKLGNIRRDWRKNINGILVNKLISPLNRIEKSFKVFNVPKPPVHRETEWAFDLKIAKEVLRGYKKMINSSAHRINFLQEIRFTKGDEFSLSPCYQRDTMWIGCYNADNFGWEKLLSDFEIFAKKYEGRPHWGKEFNVDKNYLRGSIIELERYNLVRKQFDPGGKFENEFISKIFI